MKIILLLTAAVAMLVYALYITVKMYIPQRQS